MLACVAEYDHGISVHHGNRPLKYEYLTKTQKDEIAKLFSRSMRAVKLTSWRGELRDLDERVMHMLLRQTILHAVPVRAWEIYLP